MSSFPDPVTWIAAVAASVQAITAVVHFRQGRTTSEPGPRAATADTLVKRGLIVSVPVALWIAGVDYTRERERLGAITFSVVRDELENSTFLRYAVFAGDVLVHTVIAILACATLVVIVRSLIVGRLDRSQTLVHLVTPAVTVTAGVLVVVTDTRYFWNVQFPWPLIPLGIFIGLRTNVGDQAEQSSDDGGRLDTTTDSGAQAPPVGRIGRWASQSPGRGRTLTVLAMVLGALGLFMLFSGSALYKHLFSEADADVARLPLWERLLIMAAVLVVGGLLFGGSSALLKRGKQHLHRIIPSFEELDGERYLLYLRPFAIDPVMALPPTVAPGWLFRSPFEIPGLTQEEFIVRQFHGLGRIVAIGQPGERLPEIGAERGYVTVDDWQDTVSRLLQGAHAVIMTAAPGAGTVWEFTEAVRTTSPVRLLLLVYGDVDYDAFREAAAREYATRSSAEAADADWPPLPQLPDIPRPAPQAKGIPWDFPLRGILSFDDRWRPQFTRFPPTVPRMRHVWTVRRLVRRELEPALAPVSQLPPARPPA